MGTAHGTEELRLCSHGLACQAGAWGHYIGVCLGYGNIWTKINSGPAKIKSGPKIFCEAHNLPGYVVNLFLFTFKFSICMY